ncbi:xanthotoxin 5-hydroxylase CYP82C4-like [Elaeis guineensis]|uniref:Xanthotoxin 5-hydroxylase CYP82C4-like n=1 Tax=Elaeis guineensis var. tenera TaxID=51953 RepID=A0A6I9RXI3_ELAGV|nr:xanthotoxin 5-hydroxylase CYP82C4-like [Elaeis guineensis]
MDASHFHSLGLLPILLLLLVLVSNRWMAKKSKSAKRRNQAPRPAGAWPVLGHLPLLGSHNNIGRALKALADASGPVFSLRLGASPALVVGTREAAKECFTVHDKALAGRPRSTASKLMCYNNAMVGFSSYGPYWREVRKILTIELLSHARLGSLAHVRASEVDAFAKTLYGLCRRGDEGPARVEISKWFQELTFNVVVKMVAGKRCFVYGAVDDGGSSESRRFIGAIQRMMELLRAFVISDVVPFLKWMDFGGYEKAMKRNAAVMDCIIGGWLREHRERRMEGRGDGKQDFMDVMLAIMEKEGELLSDHDPDTVIKANSLALIIGGTDTTSVTMTWALALMLNHPHVLRKAQEELEAHVGRARNVNESDVEKLVYLQAIVKETLRLYPPGPILLPHQAMEDCQVAGFDVPAGTQVLVNAWAIQRDPQVWPEPSAFRPERFLTSHGDVGVRGRQLELLPFGSGRRACPGASFALQVVHLTLARIIHGFDLETPTGEPVDMTEGKGATLPKATPLEVLVTPRLAPVLYQ